MSFPIAQLIFNIVTFSVSDSPEMSICTSQDFSVCDLHKCAGLLENGCRSVLLYWLAMISVCMRINHRTIWAHLRSGVPTNVAREFYWLTFTTSVSVDFRCVIFVVNALAEPSVTCFLWLELHQLQEKYSHLLIGSELIYLFRFRCVGILLFVSRVVLSPFVFTPNKVETDPWCAEQTNTKPFDEKWFSLTTF